MKRISTKTVYTVSGCPFCNGEPSIYADTDDELNVTAAYLECDRCHARSGLIEKPDWRTGMFLTSHRSPYRSCISAAVAEWNGRVTISAHRIGGYYG